MSQSKKNDAPEKKSTSILGWLALVAVLGAIGAFAFLRSGTDVTPQPAETAQTAPTSQPAAAPSPVETKPAAPVVAQSQPETAAKQESAGPVAAPAKPSPPVKTADSAPVSPVSPQAQPDSEYRIPAYYDNPDAAEPLSPTLDPDTVQPHARAAYEVAKKKPRLLAQLPCFCYCDRFGHKSLHDCYAGNHAEECEICMREAIEADQMDSQGMSPQEIRSVLIQSHHPRS